MYKDRKAAGEVLAEKIAARNFPEVALLGVPRGGIIVAEPVAERLSMRLDVLVTRKIGHPANPELAVGAVMPDGSAVLDERLIEVMGIPRDYIRQRISAEHEELRRRTLLYTGAAAPLLLRDKTAIVIDDGIATGYTLRAAVRWLKNLKPAKTVIAVPVAPRETISEFAGEVDEIICPLQPLDFSAVGMFYQSFTQNTDREVIDVLNRINVKHSTALS